jgi:hypothetical protein
MRQRLWHCGLLLLALAGLWCGALGRMSRGQEKPPESPPAADSRADNALPGEKFPQVYYLKDRDGNLRAVPNFPYEEFMELWKLQHQLAGESRRPAYSIQSLMISGTASATSAELVAKATIAVHEAGWVGVPLRLNDAHLRERPAYAGPGDHELDVDPARNGYVVWIHGGADQIHEVTFKFAVAVEQVGTQSRLQLSVPSAAVSQLQLQVPLARAEAKVSEGSKLDAARPLAGGKTELKVIGLAGDFELSWHPADSQVPSVPTILAVSTDQEIRMNGRNVSTDATLSVRSLGSEFDHFQVRLPPGADYIGPSQPGVSLVAVDASAASGKLYEVTLDKKTTGPVEVHLVTERTHNSTQPDEMLQLAGFEVPGARRQSGNVDVQVEGNWRIVWGETNHVRPVDDVAVRRGARFEYFDQPYSLPARVEAQETRIRVEPEYVLLVGGNEARLQARLKYTIRGAKKRSLEIKMPGWEVDKVGPDALVDSDASATGTGESFAIQLRQETGSEIELTLEARRKIDAGAERVELPLPEPQGDVAAADVAIVSDDNVELLPLPDDTTALAAQAVRPQMKLPKRQQDALYYRTTGPGAQFVAAIKLHEQSISTAMITQLDVGQDDTEVDRRITFQVAYQPTDHFTLSVPRSIRPERLTVLYDGERIVPVPLRPGLLSNEATALVQVNLPAPRIGRCELQISYTLAHDKLPAEGSAPLAVPLVIPGEGQMTANDLTVVPRPGIAVSYPPGPWTQEKQAEQTAGKARLVLAAERAIAEVKLAVSSEQSPTQSSTIVERAWIQTHLTKTSRQDRAVFRLATRQGRLPVRLPGGADVRSLVLEVDAVRVAPESMRQREVTVPLPVSSSGEHLLEMRYHFANRAGKGSLTLEGPQIPSAAWVQQLYWQLDLPEDEQILFAPSTYTEEQTWVWSDYFWQRRPTLSQRDLQNWIVAGPGGDWSRLPGTTSWPEAAREPSGAGSTNRFLFSTVGTIEPLDPYTLGRAQLVLFASLPVLACGLILIYFSAARHPAVLFVLAVLLAGASFAAPRSALLLAQASALGLALAGVAALLARMLPRITPAAIPVRESSQSLRERSATERYQRPHSGSSRPASTATDPLIPTSPEVDS